tara:strand:+ start:2101 stop:2838 length:738 start_codon:yes stop_codon:yes gene_type:complete
MNPYEIFIELDKFNRIIFNEEDHSYFYDGVQCTSTTELISAFKKPFNAPVIAKAYAKKRDLNYQDVLDDWENQKVTAQKKGTEIHKYAEMRFLCKSYTPTEDGPPALVKMVDQFYNDVMNKLVLIKAEMIIGDKDLLLCGMVDKLFYNKKANELQIWDYKTNKELRKTSKYKQKLTGDLKHLPDCNFNTYSLQMGIYKALIERNTNLKLGSSFLVWLNENNDTYKIFKTDDLDKEVGIMLDSIKL